MLKGMSTFIKLSIKVKKVKKWEIISCPQTYTVIGLQPQQFFLYKYSHKSRPKFWPKWAVPGRPLELWAKFFFQICKDT